MVTPAVRREAVAQVRVAFEVSERRACSALEVDRTSMRYRSRRPDDAPLRARLRELAVQRRRFGYRRLHILMIWEGLHMNHKKLCRLYREEGLQVRRRGGRKRALGTRAPIAIPQGPNQRWSLDFQSDALSDGRRFRIFAAVTTSRENAWRWSPIRRCRASASCAARCDRRRPRPPDHVRLRQRHRTDQPGDPTLVAAEAGRVALHRSRQAAAERVHRILPGPLAG